MPSEGKEVLKIQTFSTPLRGYLLIDDVYTKRLPGAVYLAGPFTTIHDARYRSEIEAQAEGVGYVVIYSQAEPKWQHLEDAKWRAKNHVREVGNS